MPLRYNIDMIYVIKASGERESFSEDKLRQSARRAGIPRHIEDDVIAYIRSRLYNNIPTSEIYEDILAFLGKSSIPQGKAKYSLKQAIMELGPTGFPFEDYIARIFKAQGYKTTTRNIIQGKCITHEIDVIAEKEGQKIMIEAKFHNSVGTKTEVHTSMYTKARFDDIKEKNNFTQGMLVTNTKITTDAIAYAECMGMRILSWEYPASGSLRQLIEQFSLHPITALTTLSQTEKQMLLQEGIIICNDITANETKLVSLPLSPQRRKKILDEAKSMSSL